MAYIGFPVSLEEAIRLMEDNIRNQNESPDTIHTGGDFNHILKKFTDLRFIWIDKNQCIFGVELQNVACQFWDTKTVDEVILEILEAKQRFKKEITRLHLNLEEVTFCHMEDEDTVHTNPEPCVFFASF